MKYSIPFNRNKINLAVLAAAVGLFHQAPVQAVELNFGDDSELTGNLDFTLGYATSFRATDADKSALDPANNLLGSYATPNYLSDARVPDAGDRISNVFKVIAEAGLQWRNYGFVGSVSYQYDTEIMDGDSVDFNGDAAPWSDAAEDYAGNNLEVLDAYVYGSFDIGSSPLELRAGKQVINWGEGLFFLDGVATQVPLNINKLVTPGAELKEAYIGVESLYGQLGIGDASSLEAYVQTNWRRTEFPPKGTFYGDDAFFRGGDETDPLLGIALRDPDQEPDDSGQWGLSARTTLGNTELGLYYSRYHETFPFVTANTAGNSAFGLAQFWPEDIDMFGASLATTLGSWSVNGEIAYRPNRPLFQSLGSADAFTNAAMTNAEEHDTVSASAHGIWLGGPSVLGLDSQVVLLQVGADYVGGDLSNLAPNSSITKGSESVDDLAYGVAFEWTGTWQGVYPGTDLSLDLYLQHDIKGNSHFWGNFAEDRTLGALTATAAIGTDLEASAGYSWVSQDNSHYETQDVVNLSVNYKF
ncbi:hypothetical protein GCM10011348_13260 [Marinobacterium nitratireducens]|uniref:DUF1302 domain-containing protein n=1 Tax=Marinobacterium nitratireducens TaxID=518897 RepID=A0A918DRF3_9GAMM|nr:DUF1302 family protein [Marinobacterium nitratireducens]GGO79306.1 hypothetical protein GCM10011348_13260 [Marinobacterium nitratireducens]